MSGIWFKDSQRSLVPFRDGHLCAALPRTDIDGTIVSFPSLATDGKDVRGQFISARRAVGTNYGGVAILCSDTSSQRSSFKISLNNNNELTISSPNNIAAKAISRSLVVFAPACTSHTVRQYSDSQTYNSTKNGTVSSSTPSDNNYSDQYVFAAPAGDPSTYYVTFHYIITTSITNGPPSYTNSPVVLRSGQSAINNGGVGGVYISQSANRYNKSIGDISTDIINNTTPFTCMQFTDSDALPSSCPKNGTYRAYLRYDMRSRGEAIYYHHIITPYVSADLSGFTYNYSYPNAQMTVNLEYNAIVYRVPEGGWIWDNDGLLPDTASVRVALHPTDDFQHILTVGNFEMVASCSSTSANMRIRPASSSSGTISIPMCHVDRYQIGGSTQAPSWAVPSDEYNKSMTYSNPYIMVTFTPYVLQNDMQSMADVVFSVYDSSTGKGGYFRIMIHKPVSDTTGLFKINMSYCEMS